MNTTNTPAVLVKITKLPATNTKDYRTRIRQYLADATEVDGIPDATTPERLRHLVERYRAEVGQWMAPREGRANAAKHWLQGLAINVDFYDDDIPGAVMKIHGIRGAYLSDALSTRVVDMWWDHLAANVIRLEGDMIAGRPL